MIDSLLTYRRGLFADSACCPSFDPASFPIFGFSSFRRALGGVTRRLMAAPRTRFLRLHFRSCRNQWVTSRRVCPVFYTVNGGHSRSVKWTSVKLNSKRKCFMEYCNMVIIRSHLKVSTYRICNILSKQTKLFPEG